MNKVIYSKQIQSFANQIGILKKRGMTFANESQAEEWLMPRRTNNTFILQPACGTQRIYFVLAIIRYWLNIIDHHNTLTQDITQLLDAYPSVSPSAMGFPIGWQQESLWQ